MRAFNKILFLFFFLFVPFFLLGTEFQVTVIKSEDDLPEESCNIWKKGDFLISDGKNLTLIGGTERFLKTILNFPAANARGSIISFVPAGKNLVSNLNIGSPVIKIKNKKEYLTYSSVNLIKESLQNGAPAFETSAFYSGKKGGKAKINTLYHFLPQKGRIDITSSLTNTGKKEFEDLDYALYFNAFHRYSFNPFHREKHAGLNFHVYQKKDHYLAWINLNPPPDKKMPQPGTLELGEVFKVHYILLVDTQINRLLKQIYQILKVEPEEATIHFKDFNGDLMEIIVKDAFSSSIFFRSFLENPLFINISLPKGIYLVQANFFPAVCEELLTVGKGEENSCVLQNPPHGSVKVKIENRDGEFVPGKITFIGLDPTKTPYFKPENPIKSGREWETFKNSCFPQQKGLEVKLPVGTYLVYASRGPEYSLDQKVIEILKDEQHELIFFVDRAVETPNLVSIDPHMHTQNSDGEMLIPERIKSVVAEGIDVAVASDHNYITNYYPALEKLGLNKYLVVIPGNEVTTDGVIHYNSYPVKCRKDEENNGAIYPRSEEASPLLEASRKKDPEAILQVNHPRDKNIGYFNNYQLDKESAAFALKHFDTSFDVLEVINGPRLYSSNQEAIEDWFHLLNRGYYFPLTGSSDSHSIDKEEPGYCRTYVMYEGGEGNHLNWSPLAHAIKKGNCFVSNGPTVEFIVNNKYKSGDTLSALNKKIEIWIRVQSAPWIAVDEVRLIMNGERKIIFPVKTSKENIQKFTTQISLELQEDTFIVVEVIGKESLFPVLQRFSQSGELEEAILPYALTNPIFIDVDGNDKFDPPFPEKIKLITDIPESKEPRPYY